VQKDLQAINIPQPITTFSSVGGSLQWDPEQQRLKGYLPPVPGALNFPGSRQQWDQGMPKFGQCPIENCKELLKWIRVTLYSIGNRIKEVADEIVEIYRCVTGQVQITVSGLIDKIDRMKTHYDRILEEWELLRRFKNYFTEHCSKDRKYDDKLRQLENQLYQQYWQTLPKDVDKLMQNREQLWNDTHNHGLGVDIVPLVTAAAIFLGAPAWVVRIITEVGNSQQPIKPSQPESTPQPAMPFRKAG
jgi:hypothetical protein